MSQLTIPLAMFGLIPVGLLLVAWLRPVRGVAAIFVLGWLFLPVSGYGISGLPDYTKAVAVGLAAAVSIIVFDVRTVLQFRFRWIDLPILAWCCTPVATSILNGLGASDGISSAVGQVLNFGIPWIVGRMYFTTQANLRDLALAVVFGGLLYVPLCLFEVKMSPQLHYLVYGFHQHDFQQTKRPEGWRPTVFLQHGLAVGLYMMSAALVCFWLTLTGSLSRLLRLPAWWFGVALVVTAFLCKSFGALVLLVAFLLAMWGGRAMRARWPMYALLAFVPFYVALRGFGLWSGQELVDLVAPITTDRAASLQTRLEAENLLGAHAREQPWFGWGSWGRNLVYNEHGRESVAPDGLWIIVFGTQGLVGLAAMVTVFLLPATVYVRRLAPARLFSREHASGLVVAALVVAFAIDCLFNAMPNPMYLLASGGVASLVTARTVVRAGMNGAGQRAVPRTSFGAGAPPRGTDGGARAMMGVPPGGAGAVSRPDGDPGAPGAKG